MKNYFGAVHHQLSRCEIQDAQCKIRPFLGFTPDQNQICKNTIQALF